MEATTIMNVLTARDGDISEQDKDRVKKLTDSTTEAEQQGVLSTLRRGGSLQDSLDWLDSARSSARDMKSDAYEVALSLYGDSTVLAWRECLNIAPALTYRSEALERSLAKAEA